jgi:NADH-quinone oxidoreductase subunit L
MQYLIWLIPALPLAGFLLNLFLVRDERQAGLIASATVLGSFVAAAVATVALAGLPEDARRISSAAWQWISAGSLQVPFGIMLDPLTAAMALLITGVGGLIHVYSIGYMRGDARVVRYFAFLNLFVTMMLFLVMANNMLLLFLGWEGVGLCSFLLIGHWFERKAAGEAAVKAFVVNRIGDAAFILAMLAIFDNFGTLNFYTVDVGGKLQPGFLDRVGEIAGLSFGPSWQLIPVVAGIAFLLLIGATGKSAQLPLFVWLPDAMAGPTPVSALIHAATMVVAGVYLGARLYPVFWNGFSIGNGGVNFMVLIGGITIIIGALLAFVQDDIKKVLAYSTISQLGYMVMALGAGAWVAAVFHLFTHAFFKALLFLGAGSVSHSGSHHSFDMKKDMGGLRKFMPITFWTFIVGTLALAGIFPFAGFWSKDEILVTAGNSGYDFFLIVGLVGAFLTAAYMTRCVYLTFFGEYRGHGHPHESEPVITVPLIILAVFAVLAGFLNAAAFHIEKFASWVEPRVAFPELVHPAFDYPKAAISLSIAAIGIGVAAFFFFKREKLGKLNGLTERNKVAHAGYMFLVNKYYLDALYENVIVASIRGGIARGSYWFNQHVIDGVVNGTGKGTKAVGQWTYEFLDRKVVDGAVNGTAEVTAESGGLLRYFQAGRVQRYALYMFAAVGLLALLLLIANI